MTFTVTWNIKVVTRVIHIHMQIHSCMILHSMQLTMKSRTGSCGLTP